MTGGGGGQQSGRGAPADAGSKTPNNGMQRNRYVSVTPQCRHLPVVLKLVIEQPHIENVLAAVANDRLRIQITQVEVRHVGKVKTSGAIGDFVPGESMGNGKVMPGAMYPGAGSGGYPGAGSSGGRPGMMMPSAGPTGPAGGGSGDGPPKMRPPMPPAGGSGDGPRMRPPKSPGGTTSGKAAEGTTVQDPNMVELTIYGIAALYERFPPKPSPTPGEGGPDAPPAPGAR